MPEYSNENRGAIWKNDKKETDRHPDFKGSINIEGKEYWLSGWKRGPDANPNAPALKLSVQPKEQQQAKPSAAQLKAVNTPAPASGGGFDDDVPFAPLEKGWLA